MNEQNPPPYHLRRARQCHKIQGAILIGCLAILGYLLIALDSRNLLTLILVLLFIATPLTVAFFAVDRKIKYWESPYQLYSQEFCYKPKLKSGIRVPIEGEYHFPVAVSSQNVLERINAVAEDGINKFFGLYQVATDYEETRKLLVEILTPEIDSLDIEVFRIRILKIHFPSSQQHYSLMTPYEAEGSEFAPPKSMAASAE